jgi:transcriptional regulator with XRE-family HTH domain
MAKNYNLLRGKMSPAARERARQLADQDEREMALDELRQACDMTQQQLARILRVNQAAVSKMERRTDMYLSTLREFIRAMGGELKITATFPGGGQVEIKQFEQHKKAGAGG